jgi:hypothetical protein
MADPAIPPGVCIGGWADEVTLHCIKRPARAGYGAPEQRIRAGT